MARALTVLTFVLATTPGVAAAETCMCVAAQPTWDGGAPSAAYLTSTQFEPEQLRPEQLGPEGLSAFVAEPVTPFESVEVGPFFSSDGSLLSSAPRAAPRRGGSRQALWCASPDDPRCSGRDVPQERGPQTGDASHGAAPGVVVSHRLDAHRTGTVQPGPVDGGPRRGTRERLERPPRA